MPTHDVPYKLHTEATTSTTEYTSTFPQEKPPEKKPGIISRAGFYFRAVRWLWQHRAEPNNRHKWRRMMREVRE